MNFPNLKVNIDFHIGMELPAPCPRTVQTLQNHDQIAFCTL